MSPHLKNMCFVWGPPIVGPGNRANPFSPREMIRFFFTVGPLCPAGLPQLSYHFSRDLVSYNRSNLT